MLIRDMVVGRTMERLLRRLRSTRLMRGNMFHREENMMRDGTRREMGGGREVRVSMRRLDIIVLLLKRASPMVHRNMSNLLRRLDTNLLRVASTADRLLQEGINLLEDIRHRCRILNLKDRADSTLNPQSGSMRSQKRQSRIQREMRLHTIQLVDMDDQQVRLDRIIDMVLTAVFRFQVVRDLDMVASSNTSPIQPEHHKARS